VTEVQLDVLMEKVMGLQTALSTGLVMALLLV